MGHGYRRQEVPARGCTPQLCRGLQAGTQPARRHQSGKRNQVDLVRAIRARFSRAGPQTCCGRIKRQAGPGAVQPLYQSRLRKGLSYGGHVEEEIGRARDVVDKSGLHLLWRSPCFSRVERRPHLDEERDEGIRRIDFHTGEE